MGYSGAYPTRHQFKQLAVIHLLGKSHCKLILERLLRFCTNKLLDRTCTWHLSVNTQRIGTVQRWKLFSYLPGVQSMFVPQLTGLSIHGRRQYFFYMCNFDHIGGHQQDVFGSAYSHVTCIDAIYASYGIILIHGACRYHR